MDDGPALAGELLSALGEPVERDVLALEQARVAKRDAMPLDRGDRAVAGDSLECGRPRCLEPALARSTDNRLRQFPLLADVVCGVRIVIRRRRSVKECE